jgi:hypothetical protein
VELLGYAIGLWEIKFWKNPEFRIQNLNISNNSGFGLFHLDSPIGKEDIKPSWHSTIKVEQWECAGMLYCDNSLTIQSEQPL